MGPLSLATGVVGLRSPYVAKGVEEFAKTADKSAAETVTGVLARLKARWSGDAEATQSLVNFEQKPERYQPVLTDVLREKLGSDPELARELAAVLQALEPQLHVIERMTEGTNVIGVKSDEVTQARVTVTQDIEHARDVTGAEIKKLSR